MIQTRLHDNLPVTDATTVAAEIDRDDVILVSGFGRVGYPKALPLALAESDRELNLTIVSGAVVGDEIDTELVKQDAIARRYPAQTSDALRQAINDDQIAYNDRHLSRVGLEARTGYYGTPDVAIIEAIAVGEDWLIPSASIGQTPAFVEAADTLIVELNEAQPLELQLFHDIYPRQLGAARSAIPLAHPTERIGQSRIGFDPDKLRAVVKTGLADKSYEFRNPTDRDREIATHLLAFLETELERNPALTDRLVVEFGVGSRGNALASAFSEAELDRELVYFGEVFQDGLLDAIETGTITGASATSLALSESGFDRLFDDIDTFTEKIVLRNSNISNHPGLIDRFSVVSINSVLEVDIYGRANATHINGSHVVNGIGGGSDFTRNSLLGILVTGSTARDGSISRVVPMVAHPDYTEHDFSIVVTEHGYADLRGLDPRERARELIEHCAHPKFKESLYRYCERANTTGGHEPHDLAACFSWQ